jgi:hypothetical protein
MTRYSRGGSTAIPLLSRRATTTPALAVRVSRSPPRQPSAQMAARSETRPEASVTSGTGRPGR